jgi:integrase
MAKARRRRDGISYRTWDDAWYSSLGGRKAPLRDGYGQKIKGRHNEAQAKEAYHRLALSLSATPSGSGGQRLQDVALTYLRFLNASRAAGTLVVATQALEAFSTDLGPDTLLDTLTRAKYQAWLRSRTTWNATTQQVYNGYIHAAIAYACRLWERPILRFAGRSDLAPPLKREEVFTDEQLQLFWTQAKPGFRELCWFLNETGCRPGESYRLTARHYEDTEPNGRFVLARTEHKTGRRTGKQRVIFLSAAATKRVRELVIAHPTGPLLRTGRGVGWRKSYSQRYLRAFCEKQGWPACYTLYTFRHTFATRHIDAGVPIERVATWLGDSVTTVERHYWHAIHRANKNLYRGLDPVPDTAVNNTDGRIAGPANGSDSRPT